MDDGINFVFLKNPVNKRPVADIALIEFRFRVHCLDMPRLKVIHNHYFLTVINQLINGMRTDITRTAQYQNCHNNPPSFLYSVCGPQPASTT